MATTALARKRQYFVSILIVGSFLILVFNLLDLPQNLRFFVEEEQPPKYILYWMKLFGDRGFYLGLGDVFENCTYKNCFTTDNRSLVPIEEFSAILFHGPEYQNDQIDKRSPKQIYVYDNQESPLNTPIRLIYPPNFFNWTMTYRIDSDIIRAYGYVKEKDTGYAPPSIQDIRSRPRRIAWFVSNCMTQSKREYLAREINKHYPVDTYGRCGELYCAKKRHPECLQMVEDDYKYYFSAENSLCVDYVTEKLYQLMTKNVVPIVYGGAQYDKLAPPYSVIDVSSFDTVEELVKYLHFLDENPTEYLKYFDWKKQYIIDRSSETTLCALCEKLNKPLEHKYYSDMLTWWFGENVSMCKYGDQLPDIVRLTLKNDSDYVDYVST